MHLLDFFQILKWMNELLKQNQLKRLESVFPRYFTAAETFLTFPQPAAVCLCAEPQQPQQLQQREDPAGSHCTVTAGTAAPAPVPVPLQSLQSLQARSLPSPSLQITLLTLGCWQRLINTNMWWCSCALTHVL